MLNSRYLVPFIHKDLKEKMLFLGGPRQVGKTTISLEIIGAKNKDHPAYLNWDNNFDRKRIRNLELPFDQKIIILDEIHKFSGWRGLIKGLYDKTFPKNNYLVTGSARLDFYRHGGDSLQGRYHYQRLHPLSLRELNSKPTISDAKNLLKFGGFPEPFFRNEERFLRRWQQEYYERVLDMDLRDLESVKDVGLLSVLVDELPNRVGSILSVKNIREDLEIAHVTAERWIQILERLYLCYRIPPYAPKRLRAVKKEKKLFLWDWSQVRDEAARFENMVASQLLKYCHFLADTEGFRMELCFLRDVDKREIDFVVLQDRAPIFAVEVKTGSKKLSPHIPYFSERTTIPKFYQVHLEDREASFPNVRAQILPWTQLCLNLEFP